MERGVHVEGVGDALGGCVYAWCVSWWDSES